jgi:hypothetical protein
VIIKKASFLGELKQISTLVNPFRTRRWLSKSLLRMNPRPHFEGWHSRSTWKLVLCLNLAGNRGQVLIRLPALFWGLALTEKVDCMTGPSIEESLIATGLQSFINMGALFASVVCTIHSNWDSCRGSKHTCSLSLVNCR